MMSEEKRVADYFVVAGLPKDPLPLEEYSDETVTKPSYGQDPITDITVIIKSVGETTPQGYTCVEKTPSGLPADVNHGSIRSPEVYLCYRRGRDKPPLVDIGVLYEGKERVISGCEVVHVTPQGRPANVNNTTSSRTYLTFRRAHENAAPDTLAVTDICIIISNKGETAPHAFCMIGKNLNKGMVGSDVFLCYKKSMAKSNTIAYKADVLSRYPYSDVDSFPLPVSVPMFCLPMGAVIESWPAKANHPKPVFSTFVLTGMAGEKVYGAAVTFYERMSQDALTDLQRRGLGLKEDEDKAKTVHCNKAICLLSHWPFFEAFKKFLSFLYRTAHTTNNAVPIERHISHFLWEVPFPSPQRPRILVQLSQESLTLSQPEDLPLPHSGASFVILLRNLGPENCVNILILALLEYKILIHSLRPAVLISVAESLSAMLFPFHWQCPYIPLCPLGLCDVLSAPVPFIVGVDSRYFDLYDPPSDVVCVDLDTNSISHSDDRKMVSNKILPKKPVRVLRNSLTKLFDRLPEILSTSHTEDSSLGMFTLEQDFKKKKREFTMEMLIQETFLRFMASILKGYKQYLLPITRAPTDRATDASKLFDMQDFLRSREKPFHKFYIQLMKTQAFYRFIEERSFVSDKDASLAFFDECVEKVDESKDEPRLLELDDFTSSDRTVFISPPEPTRQIYNYDGFPDLNPDLFPVRDIPHTVRCPSERPTCPNSPMMAKRTKQEVKLSQRVAQKHAASPQLWANCLLSHCYSVWFVHLPAFVQSTKSKPKALRIAYDVLLKMQKAKLQQPDEVCYRVLMQLCGQYHQPILAVKVLFQMKRNGVQLNAITYGYYNKAVLESKWPSATSNAMLLWTKLRNVIVGVAQFRRAAKLRLSKLSMSMSSINNSLSDLDRISRNSVDFDALSRDSLDSFMEEQKRLETEKTKPDIVSDLIKIDSPTLEERFSAGESDRGYNSLTHEESRQISSAIASMNGQESDHSVATDTTDHHPIVTPPRKTNLKKEGRTSTPRGRTIAVQSSDSDSNEFRTRVGSIVKKSVSSMGSQASLGTLMGSQVGSSAGLLITTSIASLHEDNVFGSLTELDLSLSLTGSFTGAEKDSESTRKRHKSATTASDYARRVVKSFWKPAYVSKTLQLKADDVIKGSDVMNDSTAAESCKLDSMESWDGVRKLDDTGAKNTDLLSVDPMNDSLNLLGLESIVEISPNTDSSKRFSDQYNQSDQSTLKIETENMSLSLNIEEQLTPTGRTSQSSSSSRRSSSTSKSITPKTTPLATPVTENDPLGVFTVTESDPLGVFTTTPTQVNTTTSSENLLGSPGSMNKSDFVDLHMNAKLFSSNDSMDGAAGSKSITNPVIYKGGSAGNVGLPETNLVSLLETNKVGLLETNIDNSVTSSSSPPNSIRDSIVSSCSDLTEESNDNFNVTNMKTKLSGSMSLDIAGQKVPDSPMGSLSRSISLNLQKAMSKSNTPTRRAPPSSTPRASPFGKFGNRSSIKKALQSAASAVSTKITAFKDSMQTTGTPVGSTPSSVRGSQTSLQRSQDLDSLLLEEDLEDDMAAKLPSNRLDRQYSTEPLNTVLPQRQGSLGTSSVDNMDRLVPIRDADSTSYQSIQSLNLLNVSMEVDISSCSRCPRCHYLLYDEQIMAGWSADDSNLNTKCFFCSGKFVPFLQVYVKDWRSQSAHAAISGTSTEHSTVKPDDTTDGLAPSKHSILLEDEQGCHKDILLYDGIEVVPDAPKSPGSPRAMTITGELINFSPKISPCRESNFDFTNTSPLTDDLIKLSPRSPLKGPLSEVLVSDRRRSTSECNTATTEGRTLSVDSHDKTTAQHNNSKSPQPISVPYLSPLVLRKELENVLEQEGDAALTQSEFVDDHPIIYWNLVWYFKRIDVTSHLPGISLVAKSTNWDEKNSHWTSTDSKHVLIRAMWDNTRLHKELGLPMYISYFTPKQSHAVDALVTEVQPFSKGIMQNIISSIQCNDMYSPFKIVIHERYHKTKGKTRGWNRSMYREILFLAVTVLGRDNIDHDAFDREYKLAFRKLTPKDISRLQKDDRPPSAATVWCRKIFTELEL